MYAEERQVEIVTLVRQDGRVDVAGLAERLGVTPETVRRDLTVLERRGLLRRVHGGAIPVERLDFEPRLAARHEQFMAEKHRIAKAALEELPDEGVVLLDSGSTTEVLAGLLPTDRELTVVTNGLPIAMALAPMRNLTVLCVGGRVRERTFALVDEWARRTLADLTVDVGFLGTNGVSAAKGLTTPVPAEAAVKAAMVAAARRRVLLADHSKVGQDSFVRFAALSDLDVVVTDSGVDPDLAEELEAAGPRVVRA